MGRNTSVTLGHHFEQFVATKIKEGRYQSVSEVVRAGLRKLEDDEVKPEALRKELEEGENSQVAEDFSTDGLLAELHGKHR
ncbi:type II toxin-antitoxin system ParD family antitoxin [Endozoicomonas sp. 8E]|uniref:type II toxin-antitoxin system ParD family antitoxin n=1 Tax=Endozoicomonas sp. 8E TaxID=3035692 RepID=UPI0029392400|nr:type II toxin-antitoxin system ParD family antitoxin [Endozoicomonas sp. 8E]WOG27726.1 type II toxin-antitoxin system ParD family antitoxin [Endozoicomonas sp. 8E]